MQNMLQVQIWCDGACQPNPGPAGIGAVLKFNEYIKELSIPLGQATNNIAELQAANLALTAIKPAIRGQLDVTVFCDSQYVIGVLSKNWKAKFNVQLVLAIKDLMRDFNLITFKKIRAHSGQRYNERADELAKQAVRRNRLEVWA